MSLCLVIQRYEENLVIRHEWPSPHHRDIGTARDGGTKIPRHFRPNHLPWLKRVVSNVIDREAWGASG